MLQVERDEGSASAKLFDHGRNHHRAEAYRVSGNHEEYDLEGEAHTDEAIVERGMRDGWRILAADQIEDKIQRRQRQNAPDGGDPEYYFGEFHVPASIATRCARGTAEAAIPTSSLVYSPPTVRPSIRSVGEATEPRNSRSPAISETLKNISFRFPATVISSTG